MKSDQLLVNRFFTDHFSKAINEVDSMETEQVASLLEFLNFNNGQKVLSSISTYKAGRILESIDLQKAREYVSQMSHSDIVRILRVTPSSFREMILDGLVEELKKSLSWRLSYGPNQIGAHCDPYVLTLKENQSCEQAQRDIKLCKAIIRQQVFVLNEQGKLSGYVDLNDLLISPPGKLISNLAKNDTPIIYPEMDTMDLFEHWDQSFVHLPVVTAEGEFVGVVSHSALKVSSRPTKKTEKAVIKAGNALGDLYLIGLTGLLGRSNPKN